MMLARMMAIIFIPLSSAMEGIVNTNLLSDQCFERAIPHIVRCQATFQENVVATLNYRPFYLSIDNLSWNELGVVCCGFWDMIGCMKGAANGWSDCPTNLLYVFNKDLEELRHRYDIKNCTKHFKQGSVQCRFPLWSTASIILGSILILLLINCCVQRR